MKRKSISLKKFIENFGEVSKTNVDSTIPENFKELDWADKYNLVYTGAYNETKILKSTGEFIYYCQSIRRPRRVGRSIFTEIRFKDYIYLSAKEINIRASDPGIIVEFLNILGIDWV